MTKKFLLVLLPIISFFFSCTDYRYQMAHNVKFKTIIDGATDPTFDFANAKKICFFPGYWTSFGKENGQNGLIEKQIFFHSKKELEKRGYLVDYIQEKDLHEQPNGAVQCYDCFCDLVLMLFYSQEKSSVNFAGGSSGWGGWNRYGGGGSYYSTGPYSVPYYNLFIGFRLFYGKGTEVWFGSIVQGTSEPKIIEKSEGLVKQIFSKKFPE